MSDSIKVEQNIDLVSTENVLAINMNVKENCKYISFKTYAISNYGIRFNVFLHTIAFDHLKFKNNVISVFSKSGEHITTLFMLDYDKLEVSF